MVLLFPSVSLFGGAALGGAPFPSFFSVVLLSLPPPLGGAVFTLSFLSCVYFLLLLGSAAFFRPLLGGAVVHFLQRNQMKVVEQQAIN